MFRKIILFLILLIPVNLTFGIVNAKLIVDLSTSDANFIKIRTLIDSNRETWDKIKKTYHVTDINKIKPLSVFSYKVKSDDTIFSIAEKLGLNSDTIISFNTIANSDSLNMGDTILIPSMDGVVIFPATKTTTDTVAHIYNVPEDLLLYVNSIHHGAIFPKEEVFIPFGKMSDEEKNFFLFQPFSFPLDSGRFSSNFGMRFHPIKKRWIFHGGVDIAVPQGSNVYSCADGTILYAGPANGYGNLVIVQHKYGYTSWYGHLSKVKVKTGETVKQRDIIAISGSTGISTGPHLHFEIRRFNLRENPMEVLTFNHQYTEYAASKQDSENERGEDFTD